MRTMKRSSKAAADHASVGGSGPPPGPRSRSPLTLTRDRLIGYESDRMVMRFSMIDGQKEEIACAISTSAMDNPESLARSKPNEREAQFMTLRDWIEERAARKFLAMEFEGTPPGIILRSVDFET
jgi:hypothetical protein